MPSNHTPNYQFSQWERTDKILMDDFNADNAKIDAVLGELQKTAGEHSAQLPQFGNCRIELSSYAGNGKDGEKNPTTLTFSRPPLFVLVGSDNSAFPQHMPLFRGINRTSDREYNSVMVTWEGNSVSWYGSTGDPGGRYQMNQKNVNYYVIAFFALDE